MFFIYLLFFEDWFCLRTGFFLFHYFDFSFIDKDGVINIQEFGGVVEKLIDLAA